MNYKDFNFEMGFTTQLYFPYHTEQSKRDLSFKTSSSWFVLQSFLINKLCIFNVWIIIFFSIFFSVNFSLHFSVFLWSWYSIENELRIITCLLGSKRIKRELKKISKIHQKEDDFSMLWVVKFSILLDKFKLS